MITLRDLEDAIAECQGQRSPNASTCIKLAAYYTIKEHLYPSKEEIMPSYSYSGPAVIQYEGDSEFAQTINGMEMQKAFGVIEEAMQAIAVLQPRLYDGIIRKLRDA